MARKFDSFVILAAMRTGSNLLEDSLNGFDGIDCLGEVFNPAFAGHAGEDAVLGLSVAEIAASPAEVFARMAAGDRITGFRLFPDHNQAALDLCLQDPRCAKIVLRRNPVDSFVSLEIVKQTNQWRLNDLRHSKRAKAEFDDGRFRTYLAGLRDFYGKVQGALQRSGQTAFQLVYDDLRDADKVAGLARWLGSKASAPARAPRTRKQNPEPLSEKVSNYSEMVAALARLDPLDLFDEPSFEKERGPNVRSMMALADPPLLFMPVKSGPVAEMRDWLVALGGADGGMQDNLTQKELRRWKRRHPGHRSFAVLRHPVLRAFAAYRDCFVSPAPGRMNTIADRLVQQYRVPLPGPAPVEMIDAADLRGGFLGFLDFVRGNLAGQTAIRQDPAWASQAAIVTGISGLAPPDLILREDELDQDLPALAARFDRPAPAFGRDKALSAALARFYDDKVEAAVRRAYQRDYMLFGFRSWAAPGGA